ncbi:MAG: alpha/beta hydrolase, partial [Nocardioides sp.]
MSRSRRVALSATALLLLAGAGPVTLPSAAGAMATSSPLGAARAAATHTVETLHFKVSVGPVGARRTCRVIGDLYTPRTARATKKRRVPAIMTTNGFGGSKDDQAGFAAFMAAKGYVVLSWSGLGFGGSGCKITLDDPAYDGRAASQLI